MVAYSFKKRFAPPILAGTKCQTIRTPRKGKNGHAKTGDNIQLYTGMRTKFCTLIGLAVCEFSAPITLDFTPDNRVMMDGTVFRSGSNLDEFAVSDGFRDWDELRAFWATVHPGATHFNGVMIRWVKFRPAAETALRELGEWTDKAKDTDNG